MANEPTRTRVEELVESVQQSIESIRQAQRQRARLTATAQAAGRRVTVTVNADGVVISTRFADDIKDLEIEEIAAAVTTAAQDAAARVRQRTREMISTLRQEQARLPKLSEFVPGLPDVGELLPTAPEPPTDVAASGRDAEPDEDAMVFTDVTSWDHTTPRQGPGVIESAW